VYATRRGQTFVRSTWYRDRVSQDQRGIETGDLIEEVEHQLRRWKHRDVRRGVRRVTEELLERLKSDDVEIQSRLQAASIVTCIGWEPGWLPCDILAVSNCVRTGKWEGELDWPLCSACLALQDVCRAEVWVVGPSKAMAR
jgi:hypothetical protein